MNVESHAGTPGNLHSNGCDIFELFGVSRVINCCGIYTDLGGSILAPDVWAACEQLNQSFVSMVELSNAAGQRVASIVNAEAARVTPGASAAITLAVGATMTRLDASKWGALPDTSGLPNEVLISAAHLARYKYAGCARLSGAQLIATGPDDHFDLDAMIASIGPSTASALVPAHLLDGFDGVKQLTTLATALHGRGVPLVVDAAYMCFPIELMRSYACAGADLTCFSAKYYGGPNSGGFVAGREDLVRAVSGLDFTQFESGPHRPFGRPFKMSRYDIAATVLALEEWARLDHQKRWAGYSEKVNAIRDAIGDLPHGVDAMPRHFTMSEDLLDDPTRINCLALTVAPDVAFTAADIAQILGCGDPSVAAIAEDDKLIIAVDTLMDGQERIVGRRLREALRAGPV